MTDKIVAFTTCANAEQAGKLARTLVEQQLAACVNIVPGLRSVYLWKGNIEDESELLLVIKSRQSLVDRLRSVLETEHPYDVPEFVVLPVADGLPAYLSWIEESTLSDER